MQWVVIAICLVIFLWVTIHLLTNRTTIIRTEKGRATKVTTWTIMGSWWPFAEQGLGFEGNELYLWSDDGPLDRLDRLLQRPGGKNTALGYERANYYLKKYTKENAWYGSCDKVGIASSIFDEPKRDVEVDGIVFTVPMIKGLLSVIAKTCVDPESRETLGRRFIGEKSSIYMNDGTAITDHIVESDALQLTTSSYRERHRFYKRGRDLPTRIVKTQNNGAIDRTQINYIDTESRFDIYPTEFHGMLLHWIKRDQRPIIIETDSKTAVWHFAYDEFISTVHNEGGLRHVKLELRGGDQHKEYTYVIRCNTLGFPIENGTWVSDPPDFVWRVQKNPLWQAKAFNERNPFVLPVDVWVIYQKSIE